MNTFVEALTQMQEVRNNLKRTENGALAYSSTMDKVYDMFAFGGAYRNRTDDEVIALYANAYAQSPVLATKCLFYLRDVRGGQGERRFFRVAFKWLIRNHEEVARKLLSLIAEYGRWDDLIDVCYGTNLWMAAIAIIAARLNKDLSDEEECSLLAKWMPSINASSKETKKKAYAIASSLGMSPRVYRKILSHLREKINVLECLMSANKWADIEFDKIPSKAGLLYEDAFQRRDIIREKYSNFMASDDTKVNAKTLYPYEIVNKVIYGDNAIKNAALDKYWKNLPDYFNGKSNSMMCVCDTSGSMTWSGYNNILPIDVAISLSIYAAEHNKGPFKNYYISFSSHPQFIKIKGRDIREKVESIRAKSLIADTNLEAVFDLLRIGCINKQWDPEDMPKTLVIISDMEINEGIEELEWRTDKAAIKGLMESIRDIWIAEGLEAYFPRLVYWNVNARNNTILDMGPDVSYVSGCSPVLFEQVVSGKNGYDLMFDKLLSERYNAIEF